MQLRATQHNCQSIPTSQDVLLKFPVLSVFILQQVLKPRHRPGNARLCFKTLLILSCHHTVNICPVRYNAHLTVSTYETGSVGWRSPKYVQASFRPRKKALKSADIVCSPFGPLPLASKDNKGRLFPKAFTCDSRRLAKEYIYYHNLGEIFTFRGNSSNFGVWSLFWSSLRFSPDGFP